MLRGNPSISPQPTIIVGLVNSSPFIAAANETMGGAGRPPEGSIDRAAASTRLLMMFFLLNFIVIWLLCLTLIIHMGYNRVAALKGNGTAARKIILPAFQSLLVVLGVFNGFFMAFLAITLATEFYDKSVPPVILETLYCVQQFGFVLILVFMLQKSVSLPALRRAVAISTVLSGYTIPYIWYVTTYGNPANQLTYLKWLHVLRAIVLLIDIYVFIWPPNRASKRTLRELAAFNVVRYGLAVIHMTMITNPATQEQSKYVLYALLTWIAINPIPIWRVLKADTSYW